MSEVRGAEPKPTTPLGRRRKCPQCGSRSVASVSFGMPAWSQELEEALASGRLALGGCCVSGDDPDRHCNHCEHEWRSAREAAEKAAQIRKRQATARKGAQTRKRRPAARKAAATRKRTPR